jgi:hypothetical protein
MKHVVFFSIKLILLVLLWGYAIVIFILATYEQARLLVVGMLILAMISSAIKSLLKSWGILASKLSDKEEVNSETRR